MREGNWSDHSA